MCNSPKIDLAQSPLVSVLTNLKIDTKYLGHTSKLVEPRPYYTTIVLYKRLKSTLLIKKSKNQKSEPTLFFQF